MSQSSQVTQYTLKADEDGLVGATRFGELVASEQGRADRYSAETVRNWVKRGHLKPAGSNGRGKLYRASDASVVSQLVRAPNRGGKRAKCGRKKQESSASTALGGEFERAQQARDHQAEVDEIKAVVKRRLDDEDPERLDPEDMVHVSELLPLKRDELVTLIQNLGVGRNKALSPQKREALDSIVDSQIKEHKLDRERGELVKASEVEDAVRAVHGPVVEMLEQLPSTLVKELDPHIGIGATKIQAVIEQIKIGLADAGVDRKQPEIVAIYEGVRSLLRRPGDQVSTVRLLIQEQVDKGRQSIVR